MKEYVYQTQGTCSREIRFSIENNVITNCVIVGGCRGNTQGVSKLVVGKTPDEVISLLQGIQCQDGTSCPDQLAKALILYKQNEINA